MAASKQADEKANEVPHGARDRVGMLSLRSDGTPDQHNPEIIGDKNAALAAAKEQFRQQAVSAADVANAGSSGTVVEDAPQDPAIEAAIKEQEKAAKAAEKAAEKVVSDLHA